MAPVQRPADPAKTQGKPRFAFWGWRRHMSLEGRNTADSIAADAARMERHRLCNRLAAEIWHLNADQLAAAALAIDRISSGQNTTAKRDDASGEPT